MMHLLVSWKGRLAVGIGVPFVVVTIVALWTARMQQLTAIERAAEWTPERVAVCEAGRREPIEACLSRAGDNRYAQALCDISDSLQCQPEQPARLLEYVTADAAPLTFLFVGSSVTLLVLLTTLAMHRQEQSRGWRRLSAAVASGVSASTFAVVLLGASRIDGETITIAGLLGVGVLPTTILLILGGKALLRWVTDGFAQDRGVDVAQEDLSAVGVPHTTELSADLVNMQPDYRRLDTTPPHGESIGGWLYLVAIGIVMSPIMNARHVMQLIHAAENANWEAIWGQGPLTVLSIFFEFAIQGYMLLFSIALAVLFFGKRRSFPKMFVVYIVSIFVMGLIAAAIAASIPGITPALIGQSIAFPVYVFLLGSIWVPYFLMSKRVKRTFVGT